MVPHQPFVSFYGGFGRFSTASPAAFFVYPFTSISLAEAAIFKALTR
jgi:hypothetical protein